MCFCRTHNSLNNKIHQSQKLLLPWIKVWFISELLKSPKHFWNHGHRKSGPWRCALLRSAFIIRWFGNVVVYGAWQWYWNASRIAQCGLVGGTVGKRHHDRYASKYHPANRTNHHAGFCVCLQRITRCLSQSRHRWGSQWGRSKPTMRTSESMQRSNTASWTPREPECSPSPQTKTLERVLSRWERYCCHFHWCLLRHASLLLSLVLGLEGFRNP